VDGGRVFLHPAADLIGGRAFSAAKMLAPRWTSVPTLKRQKKKGEPSWSAVKVREPSLTIQLHSE
jgi:hypothetical protein